MEECDWKCYLLMSTQSNKTYIGVSNDVIKRLRTHNSGRGAKYTRGEEWDHVIIIEGFRNKNTCLSFETGWKKCSKKRRNDRFENYRYTKDTIWNRFLDLNYFLNNTDLVENKYKRNTINPSKDSHDDLKINVKQREEDVNRIEWPEFIEINFVQ